MISLSDQSTSVTVSLGEKVTVRIEESATDGLLWSCPLIRGDGLSLLTSRSMSASESQPEYREFVFETHRVGRNLVSALLRQAGVEAGVKQFLMEVNVREPGNKRSGGPWV